MAPTAPDLVWSYRDPRPPSAAFAGAALVLESELRRRGLALEPRRGGRIRDGEAALATVVAWTPGQEIRIRWHAMPWAPGRGAVVRLRFARAGEGSRIDGELTGGRRLFGDSEADRAEWVAGAVLPRLLEALRPGAVGDWITDRNARRPSGPRAVSTYSDPSYHWPNFLLILERLALTPSDRLLEVGCGGGALLHRALESGCSAIGIDHSPAMVGLARRSNAAALAAGRLEILEADAGRLPVEDGRFTVAVSTGAIGFFPDPLAALREMRRALRPGGRLIVYAGTAALRGTPAAPEPVASRVHFFEAEELRALAESAGFGSVEVEAPDLAPYARKAGLPDAVVGFFRGRGGSLLLTARAPGAVGAPWGPGPRTPSTRRPRGPSSRRKA